MNELKNLMSRYANLLHKMRTIGNGSLDEDYIQLKKEILLLRINIYEKTKELEHKLSIRN